MMRKKSVSRRGKAKKPSGPKKSLSRASDIGGENGGKEKPISAFSENVVASWPTPDNLDNAAANEEQSGVEDIRRDRKGGPRGPRGR